jgi:aspartate aminotransferase/aminotransferase
MNRRRINELPGRSGIREMMDLAATLENVIHLEIGEPDFPTPPHVVEAVQKALHGGNVKYTLSRGDAHLRDLIAEKLRQRNGIEGQPERIVVTIGGTSAVFAALLATVNGGDGVLIPDPGWPTFEVATLLARGRPLHYRLSPESGFQPDLDEIDRLARDARVLVLNSPSNPTGAVLPRATVERILEIAARHDLLILSDEVYEEIVFDGETVSPASIDQDGRVISVFSFSKDYAMTGWRIGYLHGSPEIVEAVVKIEEAMIACPSWPAQRAAEAALVGPKDVLATRRAEYRERRDVAAQRLEQHGLLTGRPAGAFYILARVGPPDLDTFEFSRRLLMQEHVAVAPGETFGPSGAGLVRLSLASSPEIIATGIDRLARFVSAAP